MEEMELYTVKRFTGASLELQEDYSGVPKEINWHSIAKTKQE